MKHGVGERVSGRFFRAAGKPLWSSILGASAIFEGGKNVRCTSLGLLAAGLNFSTKETELRPVELFDLKASLV